MLLLSHLQNFLVTLCLVLTIGVRPLAQCDVQTPDLGCDNVTYQNDCQICGDGSLVIVALYINFPDQGPLEDYGITIEYGNATDGFQTWSNADYNSGGTIQFVIDTTTIFYLTEVVCPNGDPDNTGLGDTVTISYGLEPVFNLPGPLIQACDSLGLPPIEGQNIPANAAYYTESGGNGTQYLPGDWIYQNTTLFVYGSNGACTGETSFNIEIVNSGDAAWDVPAWACANQVSNEIILNPSGDGGGTWSGPGITDNGDGTAVFEPDDTGAGTFDITYTVDNSGCQGTLTQEITVSEVVSEIISVDCDDNGTPSDPSDDFYTATILVEGINTGTSWTADDPSGTSGSYGDTAVFGPLVPNATNNFGITDDNPTSCQSAISIQTDGPCSSSVCDIQIVPGDANCNSNFTWFDPTDDVISQGLIISNGGAGGTFTANDPNNTTGTFGTITVFGPYSSNGQDVTFTITSDSDPSCFIEWTIPHTCNVDCDIQSVLIDSIECNDAGTPGDDSDDYITFVLNVESGIDVSDGYFITSSVGSIVQTFGYYDSLISFQTLQGSIAGETTITITVYDIINPECEFIIEIDIPDECLNEPCELLDPGLVIIGCNDFGSPSSPGDDFVEITLDPTGSGLGSSYIVTADFVMVVTGQGNYGGPTEFQLMGAAVAPNPIIITITDADNPDCSIDVEVENVAPCSFECFIQSAFLDVNDCDDNGTPNDPSDDTYTVDLTMTGFNTGGGWTANDPLSSSGTYDVLQILGPYLISDGSLEITITDNDDPDCTFTFTVFPPPVCSQPCDINAEIITTTCLDNGTPTDPSDDLYTVDVLVSGSGTSWIANDPDASTGTYGIVSSIGPFPISGGGVTVTISDVADPSCTTELTITDVPPTCSDACDIEVELIELVCDDAGTANTSADDVYFATVLVSGINTSAQWTVGAPANTSGAYDIQTVIGPLSLNGPTLLQFIDSGDPTCTVELPLDGTGGCSSGCPSVDSTFLTAQTCDPSQSGINTQVLSNSIGCDSVVITETELVASDTTFQSTFSCFDVDAGITIDIFQNVNGCDSVVVLETIFAPSDTTLFSQFTCEPADTGTTVLILSNAQGCDSVIIDQVSLLPSDTTFITSTSCDPADTTSSTIVLTNSFGCDSVVIEEVIFQLSDTTIVLEETCDQSDTSSTSTLLVNAQGCDSLVITEKLYVGSDTTINTILTCNPADTVESSEVLTNIAGCDSVVITIPDYSPPDTTFLTDVTCIVQDTGTTISILQNTLGCDSLTILTTTFSSSDTTLINDTSCNPADTGIFISNLVTPDGCDSVVISNIQLVPADTTLLAATSCDPVDEGVTVDTFTGTAGCDSIVITTTTLLSSDTTFLSGSSCNPADTGTVIESYLNNSGCDSIVFVTTSLTASDTTFVTETICPGDSIQIGSVIYSANNPAGTEQLTSTSGCDSVLSVSLDFYPEPIYQVIDSLVCPGEIVVINGEVYDETNPVGIEFIPNPATGCDSLIIDITLRFDNIIPDLTSTSPECLNADGSITVDNLEGAELPVIATLNSDTSVIIDALPYTFNQAQAGLNTLDFTDASGCFTSDTVIIDEGLVAEIRIDSILVVTSNSQIVLSPEINFAYDSIFWTPSNALSCAQCPEPTVIGNSDIELTVTALNEQGCFATASVRLEFEVESDYYTPNVFTPNGDGINDFFTVYTNDPQLTIGVFRIFDRWGNLVFEKLNFPTGQSSEGWDGRYDNELLNPGVFVYTAELIRDGAPDRVISGDVTLIR